MRLKGKTIAVTAATRGIGLAIVESCAQAGALVYLAARSAERARPIVRHLCDAGYQVRYVYNDATEPESYSSMVAQILQETGQLDGLVNNFGSSSPTQDLDLERTSPQVFLDTVTLNLRSVYLASQAAAESMRHQGGGSIINISSIGGAVADLSQISYGTAKAAINHLTRLIALQESHHHIRCNAILPGMTETDAVRQRLTPDFRDAFLRHVPLGRMGWPSEVAAAAVYFLSDESAYTTGQLLHVSGGFGLGTPLYADFSGQAAIRGQD